MGGGVPPSVTLPKKAARNSCGSWIPVIQGVQGLQQRAKWLPGVSQCAPSGVRDALEAGMMVESGSCKGSDTYTFAHTKHDHFSGFNLVPPIQNGLLWPFQGGGAGCLAGSQLRSEESWVP